MNKQIIASLAILVCAITASCQNPRYEVYALRFTLPSKPFPVSAQVLGAPDTVMANGVYMFWFIKGDNGKNVLVDAGFLPDIEEAKSRGLTSNYVRPDSMLLRLGVKATAVTDIIITHPHWDHVDGIDLYPSAQVWMQKDDFYYCTADAWQKAALQMASIKETYANWQN